jgi:hypothetical protein
MVDTWRWHGSTRVPRWTRLTVMVGLLVWALLAGHAAVASASTPEMRGEWELVLKSVGQPNLVGKTVISSEADVNGEFTSPAHAIHFEDGGTGTFSGTLEGSKATVRIIADPEGGYPVGEFNSPTGGITVETSSPLTLSGEGTVKVLTDEAKAILTATKIKTYTEVEEREAREKLEQEEREARANVRGEWALTLEYGPEKVKGTAVITTEANSKNEFLSSSGLSESPIPGTFVPDTFSGTLEGAKATVKITTEAAGPVPASEFTSTKITVTSTGGSMSMSGLGKLTAGATVLENTLLTATRTTTYQEILAREAKERKAKEQQEQEAREAKQKQEKEEKEALEAKERTEREAQEKVAREAKEKQEKEALATKAREAQEKVAREAKEKVEREAREAVEKAAAAKNAKLVSVQLTGKTFTVASSELVSLQITNPNPYAISGRVTLLAAKPQRAAGKKIGSLGTVSFGISSDGKQLVKLKLTPAGRAELVHHKTLQVLATFTTKASGQTTATKTLDITLHAVKAPSPKH